MHRACKTPDSSMLFDQCTDIASLVKSYTSNVIHILGNQATMEIGLVDRIDKTSAGKFNSVIFSDTDIQDIIRRCTDGSGCWCDSYFYSSIAEMPETIADRCRSFESISCIVFPVVNQSALKMAMCCYLSESLNPLDEDQMHKVALLSRTVAVMMANLQNRERTDSVFSGLRKLSKSVAAMGPQAKVNDIAKEIVSSAQTVLGTSMLAIFIIDPRVGNIYCISSTNTTDVIEKSFEEAFGHIISDRTQADALIHVISSKYSSNRYSAHKQLRQEGIHSIVAAPIHSEVGINGALVGFYDKEIDDFDTTAHSAETIADITAIAMSFAYTIEQSHWLLDDLAGSTLELYTQASEDALTGLNNHRFLQQTLSQMCRSRNKTNKFSFIMADVDYFKRYNDTYGHLEGDHVLRQVALILNAQVRHSDLVTRYGGEEFGIILRGSDNEQAKEIAERIRQTVENTKCGKAPVTLSLGISTFPDDARTPSDLISYADQALYKAKRDGRNRISVWQDLQRDSE